MRSVVFLNEWSAKSKESSSAVVTALQRLSDGELANQILHDEHKAREWLESQLWAQGRRCPHCGVTGNATLLKGRTTRPGV
jgi:hypothetical protein